MKKRQNSIAAFVMGIVLFLGYMLPTIVTAAEDNYLLMEKKEYEIETMKLNSTEINFWEELVAFTELMSRELKVKQSEVAQEESWIYDRAKENVNEFLLRLNSNHTIEFQKFSVISVAMVDWNGEKVYPFWQCFAVDENEGEYVFWIDEITGKIIAFDIPDYFTVLNGRSVNEMMEAMADYYGVVVNYNLGNWYEANGYDIEVVENIESIFYFFVEEENRELYLPFLCYGDRIIFNMCIGQISVYDSVEKVF